MLASVPSNPGSSCLSCEIAHSPPRFEALQYLARSVQLIPEEIANVTDTHHADMEGNVKICDFGLSTTDNNLAPILDGINLSASLNDMTSGVGTHLYVSPDVIQKRTYGTKADVYSLGVST